MIVPVWVSSGNSPGQETLVYALLDTQSSNTFVDQEVSEALRATVEPVKLKLSTMMGKDSIVKCGRATGLRIRGFNSSRCIHLPPAYTREFIPLERAHIPTCETAKKWDHLKHIANQIPALMDCGVGLLIGYDCCRVLAPRQVITGGDNDPYAVKTDLGWSIVGGAPLHVNPKDVTGFCNRISVKEMPSVTPADAIKVLESDFADTKQGERSVSQDDIHFLQLLKTGITQNSDGHLEMPLPFKSRPCLPDNRKLAVVRLKHLKRKMDKNPKYKEDYTKFMKGMLDDGDAERAGGEPTAGNTWYIPHQGIYHPKKPDKIRVVFDCSAKYEGTALNDHLLAGPDLTNGLLGVLCRFRKHPFAIMCDVEKMFHRFHVRSEDRNYLRFLWWEEGDTNREPSEYRMRVHLFGATSSPGCANYGLKCLAGQNAAEYPLAASFMERNFYVDDGLLSVESVDQANRVVKEAQSVCAKGRLHLHKFITNSREVMEGIPASERAAEVKDVDLSHDDLPMQRALGVQWCVERDSFCFRVSMKEKPATRRGILSTVASIYDPLGFLAPYILAGKKILQDMCRKGVSWDEPLPDELKPRWEKWVNDLNNLEKIHIQRCLTPQDFGNIVRVELHNFSDASSQGYGQCTYVRLVGEDKVHCTLIMGKARVAPTKIVTIPRLELTAAMISARVSHLLKEELELEVDREYFWTDSQVVLGYINNEARRFHVFVANRVQRIRDTTDPDQWYYVDTEENPADHASRGLTASELASTNWFTGPKFLWQKEIVLSRKPTTELLIGDPEVRTVQVLNTTITEEDNFLHRLSRFSRGETAIRVIARIQRLTKRIRRAGPITVEERKTAARAIVKLVQQSVFKEEIKALNKGSGSHHLPHTNSLHQLDPVLQDGILRVGGRLRKATLPDDVKHPIILPRDSHITVANGFWVVGGSKTVAKHVKQCVSCRKLRRPTEEQRMADLPEDRVNPSPPFTFCGMDCFGPILVKQGCKVHKRYGLLFTCLCSRGVHIEMLDDMSTDCFINGLRCFIAIRGTVRRLRSDQGSNFVGAKNELKEALKEVDMERVAAYLAGMQCDFCMNAPHASHVGGVWERQRRTIRSVLSSTLSLCPGRLDDASLRTYLYETMAIVNSRPLTVDNINDPTCLEPLTPNHLITMKSTVALPPPGNFVKEDMYARKRWRRAQYLVEQFWSRWKKEYLANIATRQKWHTQRRNMQVGDVVVVREEDLPRNRWQLARILETTTDDDGLVRKVKLQIGDRNLGKKGNRLNKPSVISPGEKLRSASPLLVTKLVKYSQN